MTATRTAHPINKVLAPIAVTNSELRVELLIPEGKSTVGPEGIRTVEFTADQDWRYKNESGGDYYPVPADMPFRVQVAGLSTVFFIERDSVDGTLRGVVVL